MDEATTVDVLGVPVARLTRAEALVRIVELGAAPGPSTVVFVNAHTANLAVRDPGFAAILADADLVLNDGIGLAIAGHLARTPFLDNLNGTDLTVEVLRLAAAHDWRVWLAGSRPGVSERAAERLVAATPGLQIVGTSHGFHPPEDAEAIVGDIRAARADVVVVGMGQPAQERWLVDHLTDTGARLGLAVGAFLDFAAGEVPRAPASMRRLRIEWVWRLAQEPGRMWRRYVVGNPLFLARVVRARLRRRPA